MGRILSVILYSLLIILVFLLLGSLIKSCNNSTAETISDTVDSVEENIISAGETIVAEAEDEFEGDEINYSDEENTDTESYETSEDATGSQYEDDSPEDSSSSYESDNSSSYSSYEEETAPAAQNNNNYSSSSSSSGSHMIIAGNYSQEYNAEKMIKKLQDLGYDGAKYVIFDGSRYYTAIAGYYNSSSDANAAADRLTSRGIDCYVKRRS